MRVSGSYCPAQVIVSGIAGEPRITPEVVNVLAQFYFSGGATPAGGTSQNNQLSRKNLAELVQTISPKVPPDAEVRWQQPLSAQGASAHIPLPGTGEPVSRCSRMDTAFPLLPPGWSVDFRDGQYRAVWPRELPGRFQSGNKDCSGRGGGGGSASRISDTCSSTDPGGGGMAAPTTMNKPAWVLPGVNPRHPGWSPSEPSYPPLGRHQAPQPPESIGMAGQKPHLPARSPMAQIDHAIKDIRIVSELAVFQFFFRMWCLQRLLLGFPWLKVWMKL